MKLYSISNEDLTPMKSSGFFKERQIQDIFEHNLNKLLGLDFLADEFQINTFRLDTVAYDVDNKSFVIIEYKNDENDSIVDQGYAYLNTILSRKDSFARLYEHHYHQEKNINYFNWEQTKIFFIATDYTQYQLTSIDNPSMPIELYKVNNFDNKILTLNHIQKHTMSKYANDDSYKRKSQYKKCNSKVDNIKDLMPISEDDLVERGSEQTIKLYNTIKRTVLKWDNNIDINPTRVYVSFKINGKDFMDISILVSKLNIALNMKKGTLKDDLEKVRDMSNKGMYGNGDYQIQINNAEILPYLYDLIKQSINYNSKQ